MQINGLKLVLAATLLLLIATGCSWFGSKPPSAAPSPMHLELSASPRINLNLRHEPSPLVITIFQLHTQQQFLASPFEKLILAPNEELKESLIDLYQYEIRPGEKVHLNQTLLPEAHYLGIIAGYQTIPAAKWRVLMPIQENQKRYCFQIFAESQRIFVQPCLGSKCVKS